MRKRLAVASRILVQAAIAVFVPGGILIIVAHNYRRWRKMRLTAEASTRAP